MRIHTLLLSLILVLPAVAQVPPDTVIALGEIQVEATRSFEIERQAPFSLFVLRREPETSILSPSSLYDLAGQVPGLWIARRGHLALSDRIALRGASARSPFGTRGIQIFLDGIPLTMPDGQAITDIVDPEMVGRMEVVRGPASMFWGNASSGSLFFSSATEEPLALVLRGTSHSDFYGGARGMRAGEDWSAGGYLSHLSHSGFRDHSDGILSRGGFVAERQIGAATNLRAVAAGAWQDVNSPGSLTLGEWSEDASQPNPSYVRTASGKESSQGQVGLFLNHGFDSALLEVGASGVIREMVNPLPYAIIDLSRTMSGMRANLMSRGDRFDWSIGTDVAVQSDGRLNFPNNDGVRGDEATLDQREQVFTLGAAAYARYHLHHAIVMSFGLRGDIIRYSLDDRFEADEDQSGSRTFRAVSPSIGIAAQVGDALLYGSVATSYETPTTTELVNRPDGSRGFNPDLRPERTLGLETGVRGRIAPQVDADVSVFWMRVANRLLPYQTEAGGERTFFRNADTGHHHGAEVFLSIRPGAWSHITASYSLLDASFVDTDGDSRQIPGVPGHHGRIDVTFAPERWRFLGRVDAASAYFVDDANMADVDAFAVVDLGMGYVIDTRAGSTIRPFLRIENVLDASYAQSVIVNASFGRYYEPSPGRSLHAGVTFHL